MSFPADGGAALFANSRINGNVREGTGMVNLSEDELIKGGAAAIIQKVLEETVIKALALYPPHPR